MAGWLAEVAQYNRNMANAGGVAYWLLTSATVRWYNVGMMDKETSTAEEKLLRAILGADTLCEEFRVRFVGHKCTSCGEYVAYVTGIDDERLCSSCLSKRYA